MWDKERLEMIDKMFKAGMELVNNYTWEKYTALWDMCYEWNDTHEEREEIFMCEVTDDDNMVNGFMIEDEIFYY